MKIPQDVYESIGKSRRRRHIPRRRGVFSLSSNAHVMRTQSLTDEQNDESTERAAVDDNGQGCTGSPDCDHDPRDKKEDTKP